MHQSFSTYFNSIGKKYTPCQGVVWSQYSLPGTFYVPLGFGVCGFVCQGVFVLTSTVLKSCRFYTGFIVHKLKVTISHELQLRFQ